MSTRKMPLLDSCCGRWSLKTGTIISGILGVVIGAITLVFVLTTNVKMQTIIIDTLPSHIDENNDTNSTGQLIDIMRKYELKFIVDNFNSYPNVTSQNISSELLDYTCIDNRYINVSNSESDTSMTINSTSTATEQDPFCLSDHEVKIILAINLVMTMLISVLLVIGAIKRNRFMMLPWVILAIMLAIGLGISVIYTAVVFFVHKEALGGTLWLIFGLISVAIYVYLWFVVFSFYQLLQEEKGRGPYDRSAYRH